MDTIMRRWLALTTVAVIASAACGEAPDPAPRRVAPAKLPSGVFRMRDTAQMAAFIDVSVPPSVLNYCLRVPEAGATVEVAFPGVPGLWTFDVQSEGDAYYRMTRDGRYRRFRVSERGPTSPSYFLNFDDSTPYADPVEPLFFPNDGQQSYGTSTEEALEACIEDELNRPSVPIGDPGL